MYVCAYVGKVGHKGQHDEKYFVTRRTAIVLHSLGPSKHWLKLAVVDTLRGGKKLNKIPLYPEWMKQDSGANPTTPDFTTTTPVSQ
jgi:hypothetical protein